MAGSPAYGSPRVHLARLARDAAVHVDGVVAADPGPSGFFATTGGEARVDGVRCVAAGAGAYDVALCLRCNLVPLLEVGESVRTSVVRVASMAGIGLADVNVLIADVVEPRRV